MISGWNIILRAINKEDGFKILQWSNDPDIKPLVGTVYPVSDLEHDNWMSIKLLDKINKTFMIDEKTTGKSIGIIGCKNTDFINRSTEIYIYLGDKEYWGSGLGTEAVSAFVKFCFDQLNLHRIYLNVFSFNQRAIKSYEKVGFTKEGILRESVYKDGCYHDKIIMAILNK